MSADAAVPDTGDATAPAVERRNWWMLGVATLLLAGALGFALTRSDLSPDQASPPAQASASASLAQLEAATRENPGDAAAWAMLGEARAAAEQYGAAAQAFRRAAELAPGVAAHWSAAGEAEVMANRIEVMPPRALAAFRRAVQLDPADPRARYFLAVKRDMDGDHEGAIRDWLALLAETPRGAPWEAPLRRTIEQVGQARDIAVAARLAAVRQPEGAGPVPSGPAGAQAEAIAAMPDDQQRALIAGMVDNLEQRLRTDPRQPDGWVMLMRSRMTLGQPSRAANALRAGIAANPERAAYLREQAQALDVPGA